MVLTGTVRTWVNQHTMPTEISSVDSVFKQPSPDHVNKRSEHGLLTEAFGNAIESIQGKTGSIVADNNSSTSQPGMAEVASGFVKAVPLFMGPGRGLVLSSLLYGVDEVHSGDNLRAQIADFGLGCVKGATNKLIMDRFGAKEIPLAQKGIAIGGSTSFIDSTLTRTNWLDQTTGEVSVANGLQKSAVQTAFGSLVGGAAFPIAGSLSSKFAPSIERLVGTGLDGRMVGVVTTGSSFGFTSGVVGETVSQLSSGTFDPVAIARRGLIEGVSTGVAGGVGHRFSAHYSIEHSPQNSASTGEIRPAPASGSRPAPSELRSAPGELRSAPAGEVRPPQASVNNTLAMEATGGVEAHELSDGKGIRPVLLERSWSDEVTDFHDATMGFKSAKAPSFPELVKELGPAAPGTYVRNHLLDGATFETEFQFRAAIQSTVEPAFVYKFGDTEIVVPATYHAELEQARQLRLDAARTNRLLDRLDPDELQLRIDYALSDLHIKKLEEYVASHKSQQTIEEAVRAEADRPGSEKLESIWPGYENQEQIARFADLSIGDLRDTVSILKAKHQFYDHPSRKLVLPEDMVPLLKLLPDRSMIKRLELLDEENVYDIGTRKFDPWVIANCSDRPFTAAATAQESTGTVRFYKARINSFIESTLKHEQVHLNHHPAYKYAREIDDALEASHYGYRNEHESEAELESIAFLSQIGTFMEASRRAPVRMSLLAAKLARTIEETSPENRSMDEQEILARTRYIQKQILPAVLDKLAAMVESEPASHAVDVLAALSGDAPGPRIRDAFIKVAATRNGEFVTAVDALKKMSSSTALTDLRTIVEQNSGSGDGYKRELCIKVMLKLIGHTRGKQERALVEWGQPDSSIRDAARDYVMNRLDGSDSQDIMSRPVSDDYLMLPPTGERATAVRARYTLEHGDDFQQRVAAIKLGWHGKDDDIPLLMQSATHPDSNIAAASLKSALRLITDNAQDSIVEHLDRFALSSSPLHPAARKLFKQMWEDESTEVYRKLFRVINDPHYFIPNRAAEVLSELPSGAAHKEWLHELLSTIDSGASHRPAIADIAASNRREFLEAVVKTNPHLRQYAMQLLSPARMQPQALAG